MFLFTFLSGYPVGTQFVFLFVISVRWACFGGSLPPPPPSSNALPLITQSISDSDIVSNRFTFLTFCGHGYTLDPIHSLSWLKIYFLKNVFLMIILNYPVMASGDMAGSIVWFHMLWRRSTRIKSALWLQPIVDYSRSRSFAVGCKGMRQRKRTTVFQQVQPTIQL